MAGRSEPWNRTVISEAPPEVVETATASVAFFSNPDNLRLVECFLWLLWVLLVVVLAIVFRRLFLCARRSSADDAVHRKRDDVFELGTLNSGCVGNVEAYPSGGPATVETLAGPSDEGDRRRRSTASTETEKRAFLTRPWVVLQESRREGARSFLHNLMALLGLVTIYFLVCYVLTIVSIVAFIKFTEDAEIFGRGVKCPNDSSLSPPFPTSQSYTSLGLTRKRSEAFSRSSVETNDGTMSNGAPVALPSSTLARVRPTAPDDDGPLYGNGRGFCDYSLPLNHEDVFLRTSHGDTVHTWWIPRTGNGTLTAVLHHGAIGLMNQYGPAYQRLTALGVNVAGYDYPFYGRSTGLPSEKALYAAADAVSRYAARRGRVFDPSNVIHIGNSLGGPITIEMARRFESKAIILISAMDNSFKVVNHFLRLTGWVVNWFIKYYYDGFGKIGNYSGCLFNYVALQDTIIPPDRGRDLWRQAVSKDPTCSVLIENPYCGHTCENYLFPEFVEALERFLETVEGRI